MSEQQDIRTWWPVIANGIYLWNTWLYGFKVAGHIEGASAQITRRANGHWCWWMLGDWTIQGDEPNREWAMKAAEAALKREEDIQKAWEKENQQDDNSK